MRVRVSIHDVVRRHGVPTAKMTDRKRQRSPLSPSSQPNNRLFATAVVAVVRAAITIEVAAVVAAFAECIFAADIIGVAVVITTVRIKSAILAGGFALPPSRATACSRIANARTAIAVKIAACANSLAKRILAANVIGIAILVATIRVKCAAGAFATTSTI